MCGCGIAPGILLFPFSFHFTILTLLSDSHIGSKFANESVNGWYFLGKTVVHSLMTHLLFEQTPSLRDATAVLLTGDSAGAVAAINNADYIYGLIKPFIPNVHYRGKCVIATDR